MYIADWKHIQCPRCLYLAAKAVVEKTGTRIVCPDCKLDLWIPSKKASFILTPTEKLREVDPKVLAKAILPIRREKNELRVRGHQFFYTYHDKGTTISDTKRVVLETPDKPSSKSIRRRLRDLIDQEKYPLVKK